MFPHFFHCCLVYLVPIGDNHTSYHNTQIFILIMIVCETMAPTGNYQLYRFTSSSSPLAGFLVFMQPYHDREQRHSCHTLHPPIPWLLIPQRLECDGGFLEGRGSSRNRSRTLSKTLTGHWLTEKGIVASALKVNCPCEVVNVAFLTEKLLDTFYVQTCCRLIFSFRCLKKRKRKHI